MQISTTENLLSLNFLLATATLFLEIFIFLFALLYIYMYFAGAKDENIIEKTLKKVAVWNIDFLQNIGFGKWSLEKIVLFKIFILAFISSFMTLIYSEIFGIIPCALCWFERIFMYSITLMSAISLFARNNMEEKGMFRYITIFSIFGAIISLYHHILQITATTNSHLPCPVSGGECSKMIIFEYSHITFPFMAFVLFIAFIITILFAKKISK